MSTIQETTNEETISRGWRLDRERSSVEFRVKLLWGLATVTGHFEDYYGRLDLSADPAIELTIDAASLQTGNSKRDDHLRGDDFFDVENHPRLRFLSDGVELRGDTLKVRGRLSARGRCNPARARRGDPRDRRRARARGDRDRPTPRAGYDLEPARDDLAAQRAVGQGPPCARPRRDRLTRGNDKVGRVCGPVSAYARASDQL
jgi:hypothetical protein